MQDNTQNNINKLIKAFGIIIKTHRKSQGKSIYKISAEAGIPKASWREFELGIRNFRFSTFWQIADGLDISPSILMDELKEKLGENFSLTDVD